MRRSTNVPAPTPGSSSTARRRTDVSAADDEARFARRLGKGTTSLAAESAHRRASVERTESESDRLAPATPIRSVPGRSDRRMRATSPMRVRTGFDADVPCALSAAGASAKATSERGPRPRLGRPRLGARPRTLSEPGRSGRVRKCREDEAGVMERGRAAGGDLGRGLLSRRGSTERGPKRGAHRAVQSTRARGAFLSCPRPDGWKSPSLVRRIAYGEWSSGARIFVAH